MSTDCFDGTEGLGHCGTSLKDGVFRGFCWACGAVGSFGSHGCAIRLQNARERICELG
jgi:hypothetical protein